MCCSAVLYVAVCCSAQQSVAVCCSMLQYVELRCNSNYCNIMLWYLSSINITTCSLSSFCLWSQHITFHKQPKKKSQKLIVLQSMIIATSSLGPCCLWRQHISFHRQPKKKKKVQNELCCSRWTWQLWTKLISLVKPAHSFPQTTQKKSKKRHLVADDWNRMWKI